jgi:zinc transporter ZupT
MSFVGQISLYSGCMLAAVFLGGVLPIFKKWDKAGIPLLLSLSAGLMLGTSFLHLMPESFELVGPKASFYVLAGLLFLYAFEKFITVHICEIETDHCEVHKKLGMSAFIGLFLHALTDGVALGAGLLVPKLGFIVFLAIFFHKSMEAFSLTSILLHDHKPKGEIVLANAALLMAIPIGACFSFWIVGGNNPYGSGIALAFSAGTFLHVSLSDLLPEVHRHSNLKNQAFAFFTLGLLLMFFLEKYLHV